MAVGDAALRLPAQVCTIIYTTNAVDSVHMRLRRSSRIVVTTRATSSQPNDVPGVAQHREGLEAAAAPLEAGCESICHDARPVSCPGFRGDWFCLVALTTFSRQVNALLAGTQSGIAQPRGASADPRSIVVLLSSALSMPTASDPLNHTQVRTGVRARSVLSLPSGWLAWHVVAFRCRRGCALVAKVAYRRLVR